MRNLIAIFFLLNIIFCQVAATSQNIEQGRKIFNKLKKSGDLGKELFETIQIELSADGEDQTVVSKVIELLREVQQDLLDQQNEKKTEKQNKDDTCYAQVNGLKAEIKIIDERLDGLSDNLPLKKDQMDLKQQELKAAQEELDFYQAQLVSRDAKAAKNLAKYNEGKEEHDQMTAALEKARRLIVGLKQDQTFLQTTSRTTTLAQIKSHFTQSLENVQSAHNKGFLKFLMQMSQVVDSDLVDEFLGIMDDLLDQINETQVAEARSESNRKQRYADDRQRLNDNIANTESSIRDATSAAVQAEKSWRQTKEEVDSNQESLDSKNQQLDDHRKSCDSATSSLASTIENLDEILDLIRQVLLLLENSSIQGAKMMVSETEDDSSILEPSQSAEVTNTRLKFVQKRSQQVDDILFN